MTSGSVKLRHAVRFHEEREPHSPAFTPMNEKKPYHREKQCSTVTSESHFFIFRSFPIHAKYDVTNLKRSDVRPTDEL